MKLTRRQLSAAALASLAARAQTPAPPTPATPEAELQGAKDQVKATAEALSQVEVPITTEPAFSFEV
jgi:hypothetical protein